MLAFVIQNHRTARARTSGENLLVVLLVMAPPSPELEPPINPERFIFKMRPLTSAISERASERSGRGLNYLFNNWVEQFGPVKDCEVRIRQQSIRKVRTDARRRYEHDIGAAYALEVLSYHIEAFYLPGEDAAFVYDLTAHYISQAGDAARRMAGESQKESESGSRGL